MATNKTWSMSAFCQYGNECLNGKNKDIQSAFRTDLKKAIAHAGYPSKDEIGVIDEITDFDMSATLSKVPELVSGFMNDEQRSFAIPAADKKTAPATIKIVEIDKKVKTGINQMGANKGQEYKSVTAAHKEVKVKSNTKDFKEKK